ncbi:Uu.00g072980.m01.CDS01 [Anthostomella pinea]|uniref:Uu.00g072980.m01.CDS01 n=1 Tax=Anthostomella pinea TaxID=933095 RepID=A0AAI8YNW0_9PEZI|nr:Uu.00g072980.m01.CDS01 [Anthostomella pinea]
MSKAGLISFRAHGSPTFSFAVCPPAALLLICFPHMFGVLHAAIIHGYPIFHVLRVSLVLLGGSFFCNNASHAWNDLIEAPIDALIERTRTRPIPRGAVSRTAALLFTITQALGAAAFLLLLPAEAAIAAIPNIAGTAYYPFSKRHSYFPQLVLGFCLSWGILVGGSALGVAKIWMDTSTLCLLTASISWVVIFDTIYAHQDLADDVKVGVKSTAVLFQNHSRAFLWCLVIGMSASLVASGYYGHMSLLYYVFAVGGSLWSVATMVMSVELNDPASCWKWFSQGFLLTGSAILCGLVMEFVARREETSDLCS